MQVKIGFYILSFSRSGFKSLTFYAPNYCPKTLSLTLHPYLESLPLILSLNTYPKSLP